MKRKLTTILCADVKGYSSLMAEDEAATLTQLQRYRKIMDGLFASHDGRKVNTWGDATIAEFTSVVEAVRCAVEIQEAVSTENRALPENKQMQFRIGINLGDVMIDGEDIYGDGVNVAARLESIAEPGGIVVSGTVHELSRKQLALGFDFIGNKKVKNIDDPIPSFKVRMSRKNAPEEQANVSDQSKTEDLAAEAMEMAEETVFTKTAEQAQSHWSWITTQPKRVRNAAIMVGFFFGLNVLFSGIANPWFIYPSAPFAIYIFLHWRHQRKHDRG